MEKQSEFASPSGKEKGQALRGTESFSPLSQSCELVRINSEVEVHDLQLKKSYTIKIVLPDSVDLKKRWISAFAPLSVALLGHKMGDVVTMQTDGGKKLRIMKVLNSMP